MGSEEDGVCVMCYVIKCDIRQEFIQFIALVISYKRNDYPNQSKRHQHGYHHYLQYPNLCFPTC
jgi:hypothetical protein